MSQLSDLWRVAADGGAPERMTTSGGIGSAISCTADGHPVTLVEHPATETCEPLLSELRADGSLRPVLFGNAAAVIVSDNGRTLAAIATQNGETGAVVFRLDGTVLHTLGRGTFPYDFSPDGRWLLFSQVSEGGTDLALLDLETGTRRNLPPTAGDETTASFSADGSAR